DGTAPPLLLHAARALHHAHWLLLAEADGRELACRDAQRNEILFHSGGAAVAQAQVVFGGSAFIAMALDGRFHGRMSLEELRSRGQRLASVGADVRFVGVKVSVLN